MKLYLDDDMDANELIGLLQHEGHAVMSPRAVAMRGAEDEAHLNYAAGENMCCSPPMSAIFSRYTRDGRRNRLW